jgi:hypothetical protein
MVESKRGRWKCRDCVAISNHASRLQCHAENANERRDINALGEDEQKRKYRRPCSNLASLYSHVD